MITAVLPQTTDPSPRYNRQLCPYYRGNTAVIPSSHYRAAYCCNVQFVMWCGQSVMVLNLKEKRTVLNPSFMGDVSHLFHSNICAILLVS